MSVYVGRRDVVAVTGEDAEEYLQGQLSQDVEAIAMDESAWTFVLQPQGKVDAWCRITRTGADRFLLDVDAGWGDALLARLQRFLLRTRAELTLEQWAWHAYRGTQIDADAPIVATVDWPGGGVDVVGPTLGVVESDLDDDAFTRLRIDAGIPAMGAELNESTIPAEAGVVDVSVSFTKGCYTGQELVARIDSRGSNTPRRLRRVRGDGPPPGPDEPILVDGREVGRFTSVAGEIGDWVALAYVGRKVAVPTLAATVEDWPARIEALERET